MSLRQAFDADAGGRFVEAGQLYWQAYAAGEPFDVPTALRALFIFFDSTDPGVGPGNGLTSDEMDIARQRFHRMLDLLRDLGHDDDAEVWKNWIGHLGMDFEYPLPPGALEEFAKRGSREAAWRLAANSEGPPEVVLLATSLREELSGETTFRAAYVLHMLCELPIN